MSGVRAISVHASSDVKVDVTTTLPHVDHNRSPDTPVMPWLCYSPAWGCRGNSCEPNELCIYYILNTYISKNTQQKLSRLINPQAPHFLIKMPAVQMQLWTFCNCFCICVM